MPTPATYTPFSQPAPVASEKVSCDQLTEEETTWAWFTDGYVGTTQMWTAAVLQLLSGTSLYKGPW